MEKPREIEQKIKKITLKIAMVGIFSALGVMLGAMNPFAFMGENIKVFPFAHTINVITGVLLGPWYAGLTATFIAIIRWSTGLGTINAFSGGIPGALIVGLFAWVFTKKEHKFRPFSAFFEPIGTVIIGATISTFIPLNPSLPLWFWWASFAASCIPGMLIGYVVLDILERSMNITFLNFK